MTRGRTLLLGATGLALSAAIVLASAPQTVLAQTVRLYGTLGYGGTLSTLVELNPTTGALIQTIGPVGYGVNGLDWDPTNNTLYASTGLIDPTYNGLISINRTTGAGTAFGTNGWGYGGTPITNITVDSAGNMYGWDEQFDNLARINKATGIATDVGPSGVGTAQNGLSFNNLDILYMVNYDGNFYRVNTGSGLATFEGTFRETAHHGDFHPVTNIYYGLTWTFGSPRTLLSCSMTTQSCTPLADVGDMHTLAFVVQQEPTATPTLTPVPATATPLPVGGVALGAVEANPTNDAVTPAESTSPAWALVLGLLALVGGGLVFGTAQRMRTKPE